MMDPAIAAYKGGDKVIFAVDFASKSKADHSGDHPPHN
jgi:hypothetical protein